jgi:AGCS family alanine or glycine:cation symporter
MVLPVLYQGAENVSAGPDLHLQWIAFSWFWFLLCSYCIVFLPDMMLAYYYETNISYLTNLKSPIYNHLLKVLMMVVIMYGSINQAKLAWNGDLGVGLMAWFNIIAILLLQKYWH